MATTFGLYPFACGSKAIADGIDALVSYSEGKIEALSTYESFF